MSRRPVITMPRFLAAMSSVGTTPVTIIWTGSSSIAGSNASSKSTRFIELVGDYLRRKYGVTANTHTHIATSGDDNDIAETGTVTRSFQGLSRQHYVLSQGATLTFDFSGKALTILHTVGSGTGSMDVSIDGGAATTITPSTSGTGNTHTGSSNITGLSSGAHTAVITANAATRFCGAVAHSDQTDRGLFVYNSGIGGAKSADFSTSNDPKIYQRFNQLAPHVIVLMVGSNDYNDQVNPTTYQTNMQAIIDAIRTNVTSNPEILLVQPHLRFDTSPTSYTWAQYGAALRACALANADCYFIDISDFFPTSQALDSVNQIDSDDIHMTTVGHSQAYNKVRRAFC